MSGWTLVDTHPTSGRTFQRPLDELEVCYLWDGYFNGTSDILYHYELSLSNGSQDAHLFSEGNIAKAWLSLKRRFPLAGATVRGADGAPLQFEVALDSPRAHISTGFASEPHFIVQEHNLAIVRPREIVFGGVMGAEDAQRQAVAILHGPRSLSEELLVQLYVFRETNSERPHVLHLMILIAHCVTDGTANRTLARCFLDTLARGAESEPAQIPLEDRLAMATPSMDHKPVYLRLLSPEIRRWRRAIGMVIFQLRTEKMQVGVHFLYGLSHTTSLSFLRER